MTTNSQYGMCLIDSKSSKDSIDNMYDNKKIDQEIKKYRRFEKRLKLRNSINKKIPFFKKIRFQSLIK